MLRVISEVEGNSTRSFAVLRLVVILALGLAVWFVLPHAGVPIIVAVAGIVLIIVFLRQPALGPVSVVIACQIIPFGLGTGTQTELGAGVLVLGLLLALWLAQSVVRGAPSGRLAAPLPPLILLNLIAVLAFVAGSRPWIPFASVAPLNAQLGGVAIFVLSAGAFGLMAYRTPTLRWLQVTTITFFLIDGISAIASFTVNSSAHLIVGTAQGSVFWVWLGAMSVGQAVGNRRLAWPWRVLLLSLAILSFLGPFIYIHDWLSGWFPALVAVVVTFVIIAPRLAIPFGLIVGAIGTVFSPVVMASLTSGGNDYSLETRLDAWGVLWQIFSINSLIGLGPANYYWYTPLFPILGYYVNFNSHNNYVDLLLQTGLLGMLCFLWFAATCWFLGWRLRSLTRGDFAHGYVCGALGGLAGTLVAMGLGDWFLPFVYNVGIAGTRSSLLGWLFIGGLVAIDRVRIDQQATSTGFRADSGAHSDPSLASARVTPLRQWLTAGSSRQGKRIQ